MVRGGLSEIQTASSLLHMFISPFSRCSRSKIFEYFLKCHWKKLSSTFMFIIIIIIIIITIIIIIIIILLSQ